MFQKENHILNEIRGLMLTKISLLDRYISLLRNEMKLSVESAVQVVVALICIKYWLEKLCHGRNMTQIAEIEEAMRQYANSEVGLSAGAQDSAVPVPAIYVKYFLDELSSLNFGNIDAADIGFFMDAFLMRYFKGDLERLRVPIPIQNFLIGCLAPQKGETVFDPCCGVGDLLIGSMRYASSRLMVTGIDSSRIASRIFQIRMALEYGADVSLNQPLRDNSSKSFDVAMCWPTMGRKLPPIGIELGLPQKIAQMSEIHALFHCLVDTKPGGRIGVILPDVLIESESFQLFRQWVEARADLVFSYAFNREQMHFSFPSCCVNGLIFVKKGMRSHIGSDLAMAADEPIETAIAAFHEFRKDMKFW